MAFQGEPEAFQVAGFDNFAIQDAGNQTKLEIAHAIRLYADKRLHLYAIQASLNEVTGALEESKRKQVTAVIAYLASLQSWMTMTTEFALSGAEVGQAVNWAIHVLATAVKQEEKDGKP